MSENDKQHEELEAFREELREALDSTIYILITGQDEGPFNVDPLSLGISELSISELSSPELTILKDELYNITGIGEEKKIAASYHASDDESIEISVIEGYGTTEEGEEKPFFIHEIKHPDGELDWQISNSSIPLL